MKRSAGSATYKTVEDMKRSVGSATYLRPLGFQEKSSAYVRVNVRLQFTINALGRFRELVRAVKHLLHDDNPDPVSTDTSVLLATGHGASRDHHARHHLPRAQHVRQPHLLML